MVKKVALHTSVPNAQKRCSHFPVGFPCASRTALGCGAGVGGRARSVGVMEGSSCARQGPEGAPVVVDEHTVDQSAACFGVQGQEILEVLPHLHRKRAPISLLVSTPQAQCACSRRVGVVRARCREGDQGASDRGRHYREGDSSRCRLSGYGDKGFLERTRRRPPTFIKFIMPHAEIIARDVEEG